MGKKDDLDKFYTKEEVAKYCISKLDLTKYDKILEPSAGNGSFLNNLPENKSIIKKDFFSFNKKVNLVIGNPPYGRQASLAFKFIKHACSISDTVAFILPKSFKKQSFINRIPEYFHLYKQYDLPDNSFTLNNIDYYVPTVFQIWEKKNYKRIKPLNETTNIFSFTTAEKANYSIRRVGVYAGKCFTDLNKSKQSHYFVYSNLKDFLEKVNSIKWEHNNTIGPRSISKPELIKEINLMENI